MKDIPYLYISGIYGRSFTDKLKIKSVILKEIVQAWAKLNYKDVNPKEKNISKQILWNNSNIKRDGSLLFYKNWHDMGITSIEHVYDYRIKSFLSFQNLKTIFNIRNDDFLKYHT